MKKVILILAVLLVSAVMWQCQSEDEVYMDEQIEVSDDLQKEGGLGEDIDPWSDDSAGGWSTYCTYTPAYGRKHVVKTNGYGGSYKCWRSGEATAHKTMSGKTTADYHCRTGF